VTQALTIAYDILRTAVIEGKPRPKGAAALRYHGMLHGLPMLVSTAAPIPLAPVLHQPRADSLPAGSDEFVRLLANLVLRTHSELAHVY
jgi:hypothetical protein